MSINNTESYQRKTKKEAIWQCHAVISALESTKSAKRLSSRVTRESVARGDLSRHGYHQPESFSERWLGGVGAFPADGLGLAMWTGARTTDGCSLEGKCKRIGKTKFRNQKQENSSIYECGWNGQQKNKTKVLPFQRSWLTFWQNARVSRFFFFPWDDLPVCAHPEKITQRPRSFFFSPVDYYSFFFFFFSESLFLTQDRENSLHSSCVRILPLDANCFTGI